jgi:hypothetical protein
VVSEAGVAERLRSDGEDKLRADDDGLLGAKSSTLVDRAARTWISCGTGWPAAFWHTCTFFGGWDAVGLRRRSRTRAWGG